MADQQPSGIFRQEAIEQASSVEQLDQLMQVVNLKDWLPLASVGALLAVALVWSFVGRIPRFVEAKGLLLSDSANPERLISVSYFPIGEGKQIQPGDRILVIPDTVNIQEFGGLEAEVTGVSPAPITEQTALTRVNGNQELAQLVYTPASIEVVAQLTTDPSTPTGYKWSMSKGPTLKLSGEIPTTSKVLLSEKAPITYAFPFLARER
jgi:hypothetical protein